MGNQDSNDTTIGIYAQRIAAMKKYLSTAKSEIPVGGETLRPPGVLKAFEECLNERTAVTAALAIYKAAIAKRAAGDARFRVTDDAMRGWVLHKFGAESVEAKEFGYAPRKAPTMSAVDRANAVLLNKATRKARGTKGKQEKLKIKGTLDGHDAPHEPGAPEDESSVTESALVAVSGAAQP